MKKLMFVLAFGLVLGMVTSASASLIDVLPSPEKDLWKIYSHMYYSGNESAVDEAGLEALENDAAIGGGQYMSSDGHAYLIAKEAGYDHLVYETGLLTIIQNDSTYPNPTEIYDRSVFFDVPDASLFGLKMVSYDQWPTPGNVRTTWFSQIGLNSDGEYHFAVFNTPDPNRLFVAVEDKRIPQDSDRDYNDFVFELLNVRPPENPVPEPASMSLLGLGILGLFGLKRKKIA